MSTQENRERTVLALVAASRDLGRSEGFAVGALVGLFVGVLAALLSV